MAIGTNLALVSRYTDCNPAKPCSRASNSGRAPKVKVGSFCRSAIVRRLLVCAKAAFTVTVSVFSNGVSSLEHHATRGVELSDQLARLLGRLAHDVLAGDLGRGEAGVLGVAVDLAVPEHLVEDFRGTDVLADDDW